MYNRTFCGEHFLCNYFACFGCKKRPKWSMQIMPRQLRLEMKTVWPEMFTGRFHPFFQPTVIWVPWRHFTTSNLKEEEIAHACLNNKMDEDWHFPPGAWCEEDAIYWRHSAHWTAHHQWMVSNGPRRVREPFRLLFRILLGHEALLPASQNSENKFPSPINKANLTKKGRLREN